MDGLRGRAGAAGRRSGASLPETQWCLGPMRLPGLHLVTWSLPPSGGSAEARRVTPGIQRPLPAGCPGRRAWFPWPAEPPPAAE